MKKQKILYILTKGGIGGAQKYVTDLVAHLNKNRFEAQILHGGKELKWLSNRISPLFLFNDWMAVFEIFNWLKKEQPSILHLNSSKAGIVGSFAAYFYNLRLPVEKKVRVIFTAHGWVFNPTNDISFLIRWIYIFLHKIASRFQNHIINVSKADHKLALLYSIAKQHKLTTIHNGINSDLPFLEKSAARKALLARLDKDILPKDMPWVGSIGRFVKEKNYMLLIAAAKSIPDAYFFIIGEGHEKRKLVSAIRKNKLEKRFFLVPAAGEDARYLKAFDLFTLSSIKEGFPYTLLEAMAAGVPVVVTEKGGMPEALGESGVIVKTDTVQALASAITSLLQEKKLSIKFGAAGLQRVQKYFSIKDMIEKTEDIYKNLHL